jgi:phage replication-related protein YjqB (UPF0714/DUF867 family)
MSPHGGGIEPGTSELAEAIAGTNLSFYAFEGIKQAGNRHLHITSTRFDEPRCLTLLARAERVIAIHGEESKREVAYLGGRDKDAVLRLEKELRDRSFRVSRDGPMHLQGTGRENICNRGTLNAGVQLELSDGLRRSLFQDSGHPQRAGTCDEPFL